MNEEFVKIGIYVSVVVILLTKVIASLVIGRNYF